MIHVVISELLRPEYGKDYYLFLIGDKWLQRSDFKGVRSDVLIKMRIRQSKRPLCLKMWQQWWQMTWMISVKHARTIWCTNWRSGWISSRVENKLTCQAVSKGVKLCVGVAKTGARLTSKEARHSWLKKKIGAPTLRWLETRRLFYELMIHNGV